MPPQKHPMSWYLRKLHIFTLYDIKTLMINLKDYVLCESLSPSLAVSLRLCLYNDSTASVHTIYSGWEHWKNKFLCSCMWLPCVKRKVPDFLSLTEHTKQYTVVHFLYYCGTNIYYVLRCA